MKKYFPKEAIIGIVTLISLFILYFGVNYLKGINLFESSNHYYVRMKNVSELQKSSAVFVDGFKVGLVNAIQYEYDDPGNIIVDISLDKSMKIQTGSYVEMTSSLTSGSSLHIKLNTHVTSYCSPGDTIEGHAKLGLMDEISAEVLPQVKMLLPRIDSILCGIQTLVNHPALQQSLDHIERTSSNLEASTRQLNNLMSRDVPVLLKDFKDISSNLSIMSGNMKDIDLKPSIQTLDLTLKNVHQLSTQMNSKDNTLGLLLNDRNLYDNLNGTAENASILLKDLKENPKRYVHFSIF